MYINLPFIQHIFGDNVFAFCVSAIEFMGEKGKLLLKYIVE